MGYSFSDMQMIERMALAYGAFEAANLKPGQTVIVAPATGNYSGAIAELAAQLGCHVVALTRSASKLQTLTSLHPRVTVVEIPSADTDVSAAILAACPPTGADAYIDISPPTPGTPPISFQHGLSAVRAHGHVAIVGMLFNVNLDAMTVLAKNLTIKGQWMYTRQQAADLIRMIETGVVKLGKDAGHEVVGEYPLEDWEKAVEVAEGVVGWGQQILFTPQIEA
jgi:threonine dehydrogenase-like Zn-dependent dehydrogenase